MRDLVDLHYPKAELFRKRQPIYAG
jgi:hypothetical protein